MFKTTPDPKGGTATGEIGIIAETRLIVQTVTRGDELVVLTIPPGTTETVVGTLEPAEARALAKLLNAGADLIDPDGSPEREYDRVFNHPTARGRFKEGMSIARGIFR